MIGKDYAVADVPVTRLTHLIYAFAAISESGECVVADQKVDPTTFRELRRLPKISPPLRKSISIGGAGGSKQFPLVAQTTEARQKFAKSCVTFIKQHGFDGIDLDWEFPTGEDQRRNFTLLLEELRSQLDAAGAMTDSPYVLTIAAPAGPARYSNLELDRISAYVDWINLMTYAFHGTWSTITNFNAPLFASSTDPSSTIQRIIYNTDAAVQAYAAAGIPVDKIVVGVPFYGYGWKGVPDVNHGLYQSSNGLPPGTLAPGVFTYRDLKKRLVGTFQRYWHEEAQVPWLYDPRSRVMISYDDEVSVGGKADYVRVRGLGGVMIWELTADDTNHGLVTAIYDHLHAGV
jgi:chitinase